MSALRISRRGYETVLVDQGPACGRVLHTRGPVAPLGGMLVVAVTPPPAPVTEDQRARWREQSKAYNRRHHDELMEKQRQKRAADKARNYGDDTHGKDLDNGGVEPTQYRGLP